MGALALCYSFTRNLRPVYQTVVKSRCCWNNGKYWTVLLVSNTYSSSSVHSQLKRKQSVSMRRSLQFSCNTFSKPSLKNRRQTGHQKNMFSPLRRFWSLFCKPFRWIMGVSTWPDKPFVSFCKMFPSFSRWPLQTTKVMGISIAV